MNARHPADRHWSDCSQREGKPCDCGGITPWHVLTAFLYHHAYNLACVLRIFRLGFVRRAFRLSAQAPIPPSRWTSFRSQRATPAAHGDRHGFTRFPDGKPQEMVSKDGITDVLIDDNPIIHGAALRLVRSFHLR
jgi:hypothetical protein